MRRRAKYCLWVLGAAIGCFLVLNLVFPLPIELLHQPASARVEDREGTPLRVYVATDDMYRFPVGLDEVSPYLVEATIAFEDRWYRWHPGVNLVATLRALISNVKAGRVVSGGSTITQQVARLMEPRSRTVGAKLREAFRALQLEFRFSKKEILEAYFNLAPYGGNIQGAGAAAAFYFGKSVSELGPGEAALLASLPNSPTRLRPDRNAEGARSRRNDVLGRMLAGRVISSERFNRALAEAIPTAWQPLPFSAPHVGDMLRARADPADGTVRSTIDPEIQRTVERLLNRHLRGARQRGIGNGAVVVIENATRAVRALLGSADYFDDANAGQVNGALAARSPGSTLKPFAYALAMENRLVSPSTLLEDVPVSYTGYAPENYDEQYRGVVPAETALKHSLNVPAVNLVADLGAHRLYGFLKEAGLTTIDQPYEHYGLSLILGGVGVNLLELTNLYATLASGGIHRPYRLREDQPASGSRRLLSEGVAYVITEILSQVERPDFPTSWESAVHLPMIAWKTGTSYGHRDAWSIGYSPEYTVGIWMGNFAGTGSPDLIGAEIAGPLLFDVATALSTHGGRWFEVPPSVSERIVCAVSGSPAGPYCADTGRELYDVGHAPHEECTLHRRIAIDDETGYRLCPHCWVDRPWKWVTVIQWPSEVTAWLMKNGFPVADIPQHNPHCRATADGSGPLIRSPVKDVRYVIRRGVPIVDQQIRLEATVSSDVKVLHWFVDGLLVARGAPGEVVFYTPERGRHDVVCIDDEGRTSRRTVIIE